LSTTEQLANVVNLVTTDTCSW